MYRLIWPLIIAISQIGGSKGIRAIITMGEVKGIIENQNAKSPAGISESRHRNIY